MRLINAFYDRVERDDVLSGFFPGGVSREHRDHVSTWWIEVFGGASDYSDQHGGYENMLAHHLGKALTEAAKETSRVPGWRAELISRTRSVIW